jgi:pyruvate carboxylase
MEAVLQTDGICEPAICYSGDILNPQHNKYTLKYYVDLAKQLEKWAPYPGDQGYGGLCKPYAAERLVKSGSRRKSASRSTSTRTIRPASRPRRC